ncbi:MAG: Rieske (2Fe-2S) protein [Bacteroidota bacterium]
MERREFLKTSCLACLGAQAAATGLVTGCSSLPIYRTSVAENEITVPMSLFAEGDFHLIRTDNFDFQIALRKQDGRFTAILLRCTHAENPVTPSGHGFACSLHGSTFDANGIVTRGPASLPLVKLPTVEYPDKVVIRLS